MFRARARCARYIHFCAQSDVDSDAASRCRPPSRFIRWKTERWRKMTYTQTSHQRNDGEKENNWKRQEEENMSMQTWQKKYGWRSFHCRFCVPKKKKKQWNKTKLTSVTSVEICLGSNVPCARFTIILLPSFLFFIFFRRPFPAFRVFESVNCLLFYLIYFFFLLLFASFCSTHTIESG